MKDQELKLNVLESIDKVSSQRELASRLGYSLGKVNYVLKALVDKGFVKAENFISNDNKSQYKYLLTDKGIEEKITLTQNFIIRKKAEYDKLQENLERYNTQYTSITPIKKEGII